MIKYFFLFAAILVIATGCDPSYAQQNIPKLNVTSELKLPAEAISSAASIDASGVIRSAAGVSATELGYIGTLTSDAQTQINGKQNTIGYTPANDASVIHTSGNESASGTKTFTGKTVASSTTNGFTSCPVMTDAQMLAVSSPSNGDCVYNSTRRGQYVYSTTDVKWKANGGGSGGSRLQLLIDGSFEDGVAADGACTTCTATQESTIKLTAPNNEKSLKMAFTASTGNYLVDKTTSSDFAGVESIASCWIKNSSAGIRFHGRNDGADSSTYADVLADGQWHLYEFPLTGTATSMGYKVLASSSITGNIYVDECYVGPAKVTGTVTNISRWRSYTPVFTGFGTVSASSFAYRINGSSLDVFGVLTPGTTTAVEARVGFPLAYVSASTNPTLWMCGSYTVNNTYGYINSGVGCEVSQAYFTFFQKDNATNGFGKRNGNTITSSGVLMSFNASVPLQGLDATVNTYTERCQSDVECTNEFSAKISSTGVVTDETGGDWISSCTNATTPVCTFNSGIFTTTPNCWHRSTTSAFVLEGASTLTTYEGRIGSTVAVVSGSREYFCQKAGVDYKSRKEIVGTFAQGQVAIIKDIKTANTAGGTCTSGSYATRDLNDLSDPYGFVTSLSANSFTLPAGRYYIEASAPAYSVALHKAKLIITAGADVLIGTSEHNAAASADTTRSFISGYITITSPTSYQIQHRCSTTAATQGYGRQSNFGDVEVYTEVKITKF